MLSQPRPAFQPHLLRIKKTKVDRFADIAIGLGPGFTHFKHFQRGKLVTSAVQNTGDIFEQLSPFLDRSSAPTNECFAGCRDSALRFRNFRLDHSSYNLLRTTWVM